VPGTLLREGLGGKGRGSPIWRVITLSSGMYYAKRGKNASNYSLDKGLEESRRGLPNWEGSDRLRARSVKEGGRGLP